MAVCAWAATKGYEFVTLTTFKEVAWNMPFYARLGFEVVSWSDLSPALRAVVADESRRGLDVTRRVAMRCHVRRVDARKPNASSPIALNQARGLVS
jgi:cobalamin biosynthesis protein CbiD